VGGGSTVSELGTPTLRRAHDAPPRISAIGVKTGKAPAEQLYSGLPEMRVGGVLVNTRLDTQVGRHLSSNKL
jgi:hypothetical protein